MAKAVSLEKQYSDLLLAKTSPQSFLNNFGKIEDPLTMTELDFKLWGYQEEVLDWWLRNPKPIILKGRQLCISWVVMGFALWLANFHSSAHIVCISKDEKKAWKLVDKVKFIYDRMPEHLKKPLVTRNRGEVVFEDGSYIIALPSNPGNAVSYTATLVVIDEWAEQEYAEEVYKALKPIIEGTETSHGRFIGISTGSRVGTFFHEMWKKVPTLLPVLIPINLPWEVSVPSMIGLSALYTSSAYSCSAHSSMTTRVAVYDTAFPGLLGRAMI